MRVPSRPLQLIISDRRGPPIMSLDAPPNSARLAARGASASVPVSVRALLGGTLPTRRAALRLRRARDGALGRLDHPPAVGSAVVRKAGPAVLADRRRLPAGAGPG